MDGSPIWPTTIAGWAIVKKANETYDKAIALAYKSLTVNPNDPTTRVNLGTYYVKKGDSARGLKFITEVIAKNPSDDRATCTTRPLRMRLPGTEGRGTAGAGKGVQGGVSAAVRQGRSGSAKACGGCRDSRHW